MFGLLADVNGDLTVADAPEDNNNRGSITVFCRNNTTRKCTEVKSVEQRGMFRARY